MRTFIYHDTRAATMPERRETRAPIEQDLNPRPERSLTEVALPNIMIEPATLGTGITGEIDQRYITMNRLVFEAYRVVSMIWVECDVASGCSFGYYHRLTSYFQLPQGVDMNEQLGTIPYQYTGEQFYRHRIQQLEQQVRNLEEPTEEEIVETCRTTENETYFDNELFNLE